jgi:hypothetical protein
MSDAVTLIVRDLTDTLAESAAGFAMESVLNERQHTIERRPIDER